VPLTYDDKKRIACDLVDRGILDPLHYHVWDRHLHGESYPSIRLTITMITGRRKVCDEEQEGIRQKHPALRTLREWARIVREAIVSEKQGRVQYGHHVASGSKVRFAFDPTSAGKKTRSGWSEERLRASGKKARY
jgi:hypothetical protein